MTAADERLELLLASADDGRPVFDEGLSGEAAARGPKPKKAARGDDSPQWRRHDADPNDLPSQRWGLVVPEGRDGDRMLDALSPLVRMREAEQGTKARIYRVPPDMDGKASVQWKDEVYWSEDVPEEERPLFLLMLGDLHQTSIELQHALANGALVGRVHFADEAGETSLSGYAAYAEKVVRFARSGTDEPSPDLLFYVAPDGTTATRVGETRLVAPSLEAAQKARAAGKLPAADVRILSAESVDALLTAGDSARPSVLFSVSHGLGAPDAGGRARKCNGRSRAPCSSSVTRS